ncbi:hypothetical protein HYALB_00002412 [Hymenoscyphus albidus]|uniref:Uncharacterized protein n=1 Tax=Hymenoscyphus albidus TaxID=595503 RepID=A0A9N9LRB4_9HELO|nr:hypothetical protein HYALB_00002412 [Hymenoscyphus albidus]
MLEPRLASNALWTILLLTPRRNKQTRTDKEHHIELLRLKWADLEALDRSKLSDLAESNFLPSKATASSKKT